MKKAIFLISIIAVSRAVAQNVTATPPLSVPDAIAIVGTNSNSLTEDSTFKWTPASQRMDVPVGFNIFLGNERFLSMYPNQGHRSANMFLGLSSGNQTNSGFNNVAFGINSLGSVSSGSGNTAISHDTLDLVTSGSNNTAVGYKALEETTSSDNTAVGWAAAQQTSTGSAVTAVGYAALISATTGSNNTGVGFEALHSLVGGADNTAFGAKAGIGTQSGSYNTFIGYGTAASGDYSYSTAIGYNAQPTQSHQIAIGTSSEQVYIPGSLSASSIRSAGGVTGTLHLMSSSGTACQAAFSGGILTSTSCP